jgi:hypothetical protein
LRTWNWLGGVKGQLARGAHPANSDFAQAFLKKGYHSKDRNEDIIVDVSVEVHTAGALSLLYVYECKSYSSSIPVNDVEEFMSKLNQIAPANRKGIVVSMGPFQSGTVAYAKSNGIGLYRFLPRKTQQVVGFMTADSARKATQFFGNENPNLALTNPKATSEFKDGVALIQGAIIMTDFDSFLSAIHSSGSKPTSKS